MCNERKQFLELAYRINMKTRSERKNEKTEMTVSIFGRKKGDKMSPLHTKEKLRKFRIVNINLFWSCSSLPRYVQSFKKKLANIKIF